MKYQDKFFVKVECVGDGMHNEYMGILLDGIKGDKFQREFLDRFFGKAWRTGCWVFDSWTKGELKKINTLLRFYKNKATLPAKVVRLESEFYRGSPLGAYLRLRFEGKQLMLDYLKELIK